VVVPLLLKRKDIKMPEFEFPSINGDMGIPDILNAMAKITKTLDWLNRNMDSLNVTEINTSITRVKSKDGTTVINGPLIEMYDKQNPPKLRIKQGFDAAVNDFVYKMFNIFGQLTVNVDSSGNIVVNTGTFMGDIITDKNAKVGNNIEVGNIAQSNVEKKITFYSNGAEQCSVVMDNTGKMKITGYTGVDIVSFLGDIVLNSLGALIMSGYNNFSLETVNTASTVSANITHDGSGDFNLGHVGSGVVRPQGTWNFSGATVTSLAGYATTSYVSGLFSSLQSQINSLDARVTALENP
jgi:hypothetical protein